MILCWISFSVPEIPVQSSSEMEDARIVKSKTVPEQRELVADVLQILEYCECRLSKLLGAWCLLDT